mmetsp:Transcript_35401/g.94257  ORF Transcript_35401/g.94257 Transcript_35401/m.94257 type:complete len:214 (+) Transcript_35401:157-798(+)
MAVTIPINYPSLFARAVLFLVRMCARPSDDLPPLGQQHRLRLQALRFLVGFLARRDLMHAQERSPTSDTEDEHCHGQADHLKDRDLVMVSCIGKDDGSDLSDVHCCGVDQRSVLVHLRKYEPLSPHTHDGEHKAVSYELRVSRHEMHHLDEAAMNTYSTRNHEGGNQILVEHLLVRRRLVVREEVFLEGRRETVETQVNRQQQETVRGARRCV